MVTERFKGGSLFCERCALLVRRLAYDPVAKPYAELMSGSCIWEVRLDVGPTVPA